MVYDYVVPASGSVIQQISEEHPGIDIACLRGSPIVAAHGGELIPGYNARMGHFAYVTHGVHSTFYAHMDSVMPPKGWVEPGEQIGTCGSTGTWSMGPHLHFESTERYTF